MAGAQKERGVCQCYALLMNALLQRVGVESRYLSGTLSSGGSHAWNLVKIDGAWYHIDATWDDGGNKAEYSYFLKSSAMLKSVNNGIHPYAKAASPDEYQLQATSTRFDNVSAAEWERQLAELKPLA